MHGGNVLLDAADAFPTHPVCEPEGETFHPAAGYTAYAIKELPADLNGLKECELRRSYMILGERDYILAAKAAELLFWDRTHRFCPACGTPLKRHSQISKICSGCGTEHFPSPLPAVLVLVRRGDEALLVHARNFRRRFALPLTCTGSKQAQQAYNKYIFLHIILFKQLNHYTSLCFYIA